MNTFQVKTPAKINFGLNIIEKRSDGFHNIETIFYPVDLFDVLTFSASDKFIFDSDNEALNNEKDNLVTKAKTLLEEKCGRELKIEIHLKKNIPIGAGMGGGSSDAAATLKTLNQIFNLYLNHDELKVLALKLGSDVPFFLNPVPSFAESRGEKISAINFLINRPVLIVNPGIHISTKWAYENIKPQKPEFSLRELSNFSQTDFSFLQDKVVNDFEEKVFQSFPEIVNIKKELLNLGASFALMTGSGSTLFGIFPNKISAEEAKIKFNQQYFTYLHYEKN